MGLETRLYYSWDEAAEVLGMDREGLRQHLESTFSPLSGWPTEYRLPVILDPGSLEFIGALHWEAKAGDPSFRWRSRDTYYRNTEGVRDLLFSSGESLPLEGNDGSQRWNSTHDQGTGYGMCFALSGSLWVLSPEDVIYSCKNDGYIASANVAPIGWCDDGFSGTFSFHWVDTGNTLYRVRPTNIFDSAKFRRKDVLKLKSRGSVTAEKLGSRERNNLLRIIRALDAMNPQPLPERGYAVSIQAQLQKLGLTAIGDDTIRKAIEAARSLKS